MRSALDVDRGTDHFRLDHLHLILLLGLRPIAVDTVIGVAGEVVATGIEAADGGFTTIVIDTARLLGRVLKRDDTEIETTAIAIIDISIPTCAHVIIEMTAMYETARFGPNSREHRTSRPHYRQKTFRPLQSLQPRHPLDRYLTELHQRLRSDRPRARRRQQDQEHSKKSDQQRLALCLIQIQDYHLSVHLDRPSWK